MNGQNVISSYLPRSMNIGTYSVPVILLHVRLEKLGIVDSYSTKGQVGFHQLQSKARSEIPNENIALMMIVVSIITKVN